MFNAIVEAPPLLGSGRFKSGAGLSILAHIAVLGAALILQRASASQPEPKLSPVLTFVAKRPPKGNPNPPSAPAARAAPPKPKAASKLTPPKTIAPLPLDTPPPTVTVASAVAPPDPSLPYIEGSDPSGVETGGLAHAAPGADTGGLGGEDVVVFGEGMTKPHLLSGPEIQYTREAREARVEGMVIARCTVTREGEVRACHVVRGLPFMTGAVIAALQARRYSPATFQGHVLAVNYVFNVRLKMQ